MKTSKIWEDYMRFRAPWGSPEHLSIYRGQLATILKDIPEPSHCRVFREKFRSVYVMKGV